MPGRIIVVRLFAFPFFFITFIVIIYNLPGVCICICVIMSGANFVIMNWLINRSYRSVVSNYYYYYWRLFFFFFLCARYNVELMRMVLFVSFCYVPGHLRIKEECKYGGGCQLVFLLNLKEIDLGYVTFIVDGVDFLFLFLNGVFVLANF